MATVPAVFVPIKLPLDQVVRAPPEPLITTPLVVFPEMMFRCEARWSADRVAAAAQDLDAVGAIGDGDRSRDVGADQVSHDEVVGHTVDGDAAAGVAGENVAGAGARRGRRGADRVAGRSPTMSTPSPPLARAALPAAFVPT